MAQRPRGSSGRRRRSDAAAAAEKQARRVERKRQEEEARRKAARTRRARRAALYVLAVTIIVGGAFFLFRPDPELAGVERPRDEGGGHAPAGESLSYDDAAPTSGRHVANAPACRVYSEPLAPELAVHALEHGAVILYHQPDDAETALALEEVATEWDSHVIVAPNEGIDSPVVATAWNRRKSYDGVDPEVQEFVETYRQRGPEKVDCE